VAAAKDDTALSAIRVLVVDDEVNLRFAIERGLRKAGHAADSASTIRQGIERLRMQAYDVVVCDLRMPGGDGSELVQWLGSFSPSTRVIVVSAFITPEFRNEYEHSGVRIVEKPIDLGELIAMVEEIGPRRGFFGNSIEVELFDYVQMIAISGRDKWIEVTTPIGQGHIWFEHGDIVHAVYVGAEGEPAFYRMLSAGRGSFKEVFYQSPPTHSIMHSATHLLMEAARMMDEGTLDEEAWGQEEVTPDSDPDESSFADIASALAAASTPGDQVSESEVLASTEGRDTEEDVAILLADDEDDDHAQARPTDPPSPQTAGERPPGPNEDSAHTRERPWHKEPPESSRSRVELRRRPRRSSPRRVASSTPEVADEQLQELLDGFFSLEGVDGVAIISSTGKVLVEDMRGNGSLVTLAGFYLRGAARMARSLGNNVFDAVVSRSTIGQQMVMVSMGAMTAVLSVARAFDPEVIRDRAMELAA